jgi:beta-glucosidase
LDKVAVIGPNAHNVEVQLGNYNGTPVDPVSVFDGIRTKLGESADVRYALGSPHHEGLPYLVAVPEGVFFLDPEATGPGLRARFFSNLEAHGEPVLERTDPVVDYYWWDVSPPLDQLEEDHYSVEWSGYLVPRKTGIHFVGLEGKFFEFIFAGDTLIRMNNIHHPNITSVKLDLVAGKPYPLRVLMKDQHGDAPLKIHWEEPDQPLLQEA